MKERDANILKGIHETLWNMQHSDLPKEVGAEIINQLSEKNGGRYKQSMLGFYKNGAVSVSKGVYGGMEVTFLTQNPHKSSVWAEAVREGNREITWVINSKTNEWMGRMESERYCIEWMYVSLRERPEKKSLEAEIKERLPEVKEADIRAVLNVLKVKGMLKGADNETSR